MFDRVLMHHCNYGSSYRRCSLFRITSARDCFCSYSTRELLAAKLYFFTLLYKHGWYQYIDFSFFSFSMKRKRKRNKSKESYQNKNENLDIFRALDAPLIYAPWINTEKLTYLSDLPWCCLQSKSYQWKSVVAILFTIRTQPWQCW